MHPLPNHAALAGIAGVRFAKRAEVALAASSAVLIALMASVAVTIFPSLLPAYGNVRAGLDIYNAAPNAYSLGTAFTAAIVGFGAALLLRDVGCAPHARKAA